MIAFHLEKAGETQKAILFLRRSGEQALSRFSSTEAVTYFSRALNLLSDEELTERYTLLLAREGLYNWQGKRDKQIKDLDSLEELAITLKETERQAHIFLRKINYYETTGDFSKAILTAKKVILLSQKTNNIRAEGAGRLGLGRVYCLQGDYEQARVQLMKSLMLSKELNLSEIYGQSLKYLGVISWYLGDYAAVKEYTKKSLRLFYQIGDQVLEASAYESMGDILIYEYDYCEAINYYKKAVNLFCEIGHQEGLAHAMGNIGIADFMLGNYTDAKAQFNDSRQICQEIGNLRGIRSALSNLSLVIYYMGNDKLSLEYSRKALVLARRIGDRPGEGYAFLYKGHAFSGTNHWKQAKKAYQKSFEICQTLKQNNLSMEPLAGLASVALSTGDLKQAEINANRIINHLNSKWNHTDKFEDPLGGTEEPFWVLLVCYNALNTLNDKRTSALIHKAYNLLQEYAAKIDSQDLRKSYLENIPAHRKIVSEYKKTNK